MHHDLRSSNAPNGAPPDGESRALGGPSLCDNGRYNAFNAAASNLAPGDTNERWITDLGRERRVHISGKGDRIT